MANYPTSASTDTNLHVAVNSLATAIVGALTSVGGNNGSDIEVVSTTNFPSAGYITIDTEAIRYTSILSGPPRFSGITRGADGTTAAAHSAGSACKHNIIAAHHNAPKDEIIAIENDLVAARGALNDADTPASTASDIKDRLDHIVTEIKRITQNTNWYDAVAAGLKDIAGNTFIGVGRNRIINGDMTISQDAGGAIRTVNSNADFWPVDMFRCHGQSADGVFTVQQVSTTPPTGFLQYLHFVVTTADASIGATQTYACTPVIEGLNARDLLYGTANAKTITLSFWVRSSLTGSFSGALSNSAVDRSYPFSYTINSANTWEQKTITIAGDTTGTWLTDTGIGIRVYFDLGAGTSRRATANTWAAGTNVIGVTGAVSLIATNAATLDLTGVQFEVGSVATPFEFRPFQLEMILCQRYYEKAGNFSWTTYLPGPANLDAYTFVPFAVNKRVSPTMTIGTGSNTNVSSAITDTRDVRGWNFNLNASAAGKTQYYNGSWIADARI